jgi:hypothetical protein
MISLPVNVGYLHKVNARIKTCEIFLSVLLSGKKLPFRIIIVNITRRVRIYIHNNIVGCPGNAAAAEGQNRSVYGALGLSVGVAAGNLAV